MAPSSNIDLPNDFFLTQLDRKATRRGITGQWAFGSTLSEIIIPVLDNSTAVIGTIDVESERANAFSDVDREFLEQCRPTAVVEEH